jgi:hypothetical protein
MKVLEQGMGCGIFGQNARLDSSIYRHLVFNDEHALPWAALHSHR